jgi:hypothetical protein
VIVPVWLSPVSPDITETVRVSGVCVEDCVTESHGLPEAVAAVAITGLVMLLKTETVCDGGCGWADVLTKYRDVGETVNITGGNTVRVTLIVTVGAAEETRVMFPVNVPVARPTGLTDTVNAAGVVPVEGVMASQPPDEEALALTATAPPLVTLRAWAGGAGVGLPAGPCCAVKLKVVGEGVRAVVTVRVAGIFSVWLIVMVAL